MDSVPHPERSDSAPDRPAGRRAAANGATDLVRALQRDGLDVEATNRRRAEYSSDASNYRIVPRAVVYPRSADEVSGVLRRCRENAVPLTARGAGTSIAGNALSTGVVLDFTRHLNRVLSVDPEGEIATVQPGAILDAVTAAGAPYGLRFGPDPSTHNRATVGGAIGNNACGSRALRYGRTDDNVVALQVVLADGRHITAGPLTDAPADLREPLRRLVDSRLGTIRTEFGRFGRQGSGYSLHHLLPERRPDLGRFLTGTEGTLAVTVQATLRLRRAPRATALVALGYADMVAAAAAVPAVLEHRPTALEGLDARLIEVVRRRRGPQALPDLPIGSGWLFAETVGDTRPEALDAGRRLAAGAGALDAVILSGPAATALWRAREDGSGLVGRTPGNRPAWPGWEDAAVPPERLPDYLSDFRALFDDFGLDGLLFGHFGDGCVHVRIDFPFGADPGVYRRFATEAARLVGRYGGSMSGEHGDGRARGELLPLMYSPAAIDTFAAIKHLFDPADLLNPGVGVRPRPLDADLRVPAAQPVRANLGFAYADDGGDFGTAVHRCVGVGKCRVEGADAGTVMCPSFLATRDEKDSTRGRARVLQELANGSLVRGFDAPEVAQSLDLCLSCKGCASDCPAGVDMATYKAEALHQKYRRRLRPRSHYALGWLPRWARLAHPAAGLVNAAARRAPWAFLIRQAAGIDPRRPIPRLATTTFRDWFADHPAPPVGQPVLMWVDTFTNHFSPAVGVAAVQLLEAAGYRVSIPGKPVCCGLTWLTTGQLDGARRRLRASLDQLAPALAAGIPVVALEPSCAAIFRDDAQRLLPGDDLARQAKSAVRTLAELLRATPGWLVPDLRDVDIVAQPHCHHHAVLGWHTDQALLVEAGATVRPVGGCCGLAGNFGMEQGHYDVSVGVFQTALGPALRNAGPGAVVLADGFSCRTQIDQLAGRRGLHLAELLVQRHFNE